MTDVFSHRLAAWREYTDSPWGRIRYRVAEEILRRQTEELIDSGRSDGALRILDVGGGDGMDALPLALAGHDVSIVDQSEAWLAEAERRAQDAGVELSTVLGDLNALPALGEFDLVLCHFVLHYRPDPAGDLVALNRHVRVGGRISIMLPNPAGMVLRQLVLDGPAAALTELESATKRAVTFDQDVRKISMEWLERRLSAIGLTVTGRYGSRIANDLLTNDALKHDAASFADLVALELALCDREPFVRIGGMYQVVAERTR